VTYTLTDEDRAVILEASGHLETTKAGDKLLTAVYLAGIERGRRLGLEEAAKCVENGRFLTDTAPIKRWADECAAAIRALKD